MSLESTGLVVPGHLQDTLAASLAADSANTVFSSVGILTVLLLLESGARGSTADALAAVTGIGGADAASSYAAWETFLSEHGVSHAGVVSSKVLLNTGYTAALPSVLFCYGLSLSELDSWTEEKTLGLIPRFPIRKIEDSPLILATALALAMRWKENLFRADLTKEGIFHAPGGETTAHFMRTRGGFRHGKRGTTTSLDLPAGIGTGVVVRVGLGTQAATPASVIADLARPLASLSADCALELPRFSIASTHDLLPSFSALGLSELLTTADLGGISELELTLDNAVQAARIDVDETGVKAAAVTGVAVALGMTAPRATELLRLDRPFALSVLADEIPLFSAWVATPS